MARIFFAILVATAIFAFSAAADDDKSCPGVNEAKYPCGRRCEEKCNAPLPTVCKGLRCMPPFTCRCKNGFARNPETGTCVPTQNCPASACASGEVLGFCGRNCEGTCSSPSMPEKCLTINCEGQGCRCDLTRGYVRNEETGKCSKIEDC